MSYLKTGSAISDFSYIKQDFGPTPEPSQFLSLRSDLECAGDIEMAQVEYFGRIQKKLMPKRAANLANFKAEEVSLIDQILVDISGFTATQVSDISHKFPAWQVAQDKEVLPLYTFLISSRVPTEDDIKQAQSQLNDVQGCEE